MMHTNYLKTCTESSIIGLMLDLSLVFIVVLGKTLKNYKKIVDLRKVFLAFLEQLNVFNTY